MTNILGDILNVYYFEVLSITTPVPLANITEDLETWFYTQFLPPILAIQSSAVTHARCEIDNLSAFETDFAIVTPDSPVVGTNAGPYLSAATAFSFQLVRLFRTTRHGSKRIAGVPESMVDNNLAIPGAATLLAAVATELQDTQVVEFGTSDSMTLRPVIAKTPTPPATLPTVFNPVTDATFRGVGSQNTRKQLLS